MCFSTFFCTTQSRTGNGRFQPVNDRGWWRGLAEPAAPVLGLGPTNDNPSPGRLGTQGGTGKRPEPSDGKETRRHVGGGRGKRATPMEAPVASRQCGCVVQKAVRQSGEVVKASNILEAIKVVQQAC
jgi:hypothetical protein